MRRVPRVCAAVCGRVIFIGFGVQTVLGILWMCNAFAGMDSPGEGMVCAGQMAVLGFAVACFSGQGRGNWLLVPAVLTFPMVMQCLVTPDARVLTTALLFLETGLILRSTGDPGDKKAFYAALGTWLAAALIKGEYLYMGAVPVVAGALYNGMVAGREAKRHQEDTARMQLRRRMRRRLLSIAAVAGIAAAVGSLYQEQTKLSTILASRVAWTTLYHSYAELPKADRKLIDYDEMLYSSYEAGGIESNLLPLMEEQIGGKEAGRILIKLSRVAWWYSKGKILKEIGWDMAGYMLAPVILPLQLQGRAYDSYSGGNYLKMLQPAPRLGKLYMGYGCWWFAAGALLALGVERLTRAGRSLRESLIPLLAGIGMCAGYTLRGAGQMDYKNTIFILCLWLVWMSSAALRGVGTGGWPDGKER